MSMLDVFLSHSLTTLFLDLNFAYLKHDFICLNVLSACVYTRCLGRIEIPQRLELRVQAGGGSCGSSATSAFCPHLLGEVIYPVLSRTSNLGLSSWFGCSQLTRATG